MLARGGAARAIAYEARRRGADVVVTARTARKAEALARALDVRCVAEILPGTFDILVNATPVGMTPAEEQSPISPELLTAGVVFDAVYNPPETRLLRDAHAAGARTVSGIEMYVNQAIQQARLFMRKSPDKEFMREVLREHA